MIKNIYKFYIFILLATFLMPITSAETIFFDDFQDGSIGPEFTESNEFDWNVEKPAERQVPGHNSGNKVAHADKCRSSLGCIISTSVDLSNYESATLSFWRYVDRALDRNEWLRVEIFDGSSWNQIFYWTHTSGDDDTWHLESYEIPSTYLNSNFQLRFRSKESSSKEDTEIDDVLIEGIPAVQTTECNDGIDNDNDGLTDLADTGCEDETDTSELGNVQCDDGLDNDSDGFIDITDTGCDNTLDNSENENPIANAGLDQIKEDTDNNGFETIVLDGSTSNDSDGYISSFEWKLNTQTIGNLSVLNHDFPIGTSNVELTVTDNNFAQSSDFVEITVNPGPPIQPTVIFSDDVESGENAWVSTGLWHITQTRSNSATHSWWYGNETTGTYKTASDEANQNFSSRNSGDLISPSIDLSSTTSPVLTFETYWDTELGTSYDQKKVFVSTDDGSSWTEVLQISESNSILRTWQEMSIDLNSFNQNLIKLRFSFDTIDGLSNEGEGWFIDDIRVE